MLQDHAAEIDLCLVGEKASRIDSLSLFLGRGEEQSATELCGDVGLQHEDSVLLQGTTHG